MLMIVNKFVVNTWVKPHGNSEGLVEDRLVIFGAIRCPEKHIKPLHKTDKGPLI